MEKGWWYGVVAGLLVVFVIFMAGFYSGNVVTGQFFHQRSTVASIPLTGVASISTCSIVDISPEQNPTASCANINKDCMFILYKSRKYTTDYFNSLNIYQVETDDRVYNTYLRTSVSSVSGNHRHTLDINDFSYVVSDVGLRDCNTIGDSAGSGISYKALCCNI